MTLAENNSRTTLAAISGRRVHGRKAAYHVKAAFLVALLGGTAWHGLERPAAQASEAAFAKGDHQNALRFSLDDLRFYPLSRNVSLITARSFSRLIYPDAAEPYYRTAAIFAALPLEAQRDRIQGLFRAVQNDRGVALCHQVLKRYPDDPEILKMLTTVEWVRGRLPEARVAAERLAKTATGRFAGLDLLVEIHRDADNREKAVATCEEILKLDPALTFYSPEFQFDFWRRFSEDLIALHRATEARDYLLKVITPYSDPVLLDLLGSAHLELNDLDAAESAWRESARRNPDRLNCWLRLGSLATDRKRYPEAVQHLEKAVALSPDHVGANYLLARAYRFLGRTEDANKQFEKTNTLRRLAPAPPGGMGPSS
jgi:tetratricopeptide (TPR) repeat protein